MSINLNIGNTEVIKNLGKAVNGTGQTVSVSANTWTSKTYNVSLEKGIYCVKAQVNHSVQTSGTIGLQVTSNSLIGTYFGFVYTPDMKYMPSIMYNFISLSADVTSIPLSVYCSSAGTATITCSFVKIT